MSVPSPDRWLILDHIFAGWAWYRRLRGGDWDELHCADGFWYQVRP